MVMGPGTRTGLPNWAIAGVLGLTVIGTYYYTMHKVGTSDIDAEVEKELQKQTKSEMRS